MQGLIDKETFEYVKFDPTVHNDIFPLKWVFLYKFDANGFLEREKARLVARGDLQTQWSDIYTATLEARCFRMLCALIAHFGLATKQMDCTLAYLNAFLDRKVYARCPEGYNKPGMILLIKKALYGLKESANLWQKLLIKVLYDLGLNSIPGTHCFFTDGRIFLVFYVDDIYAAFHPMHSGHYAEFEAKLMARFKVKSLGEGTHFLGIRIVRNIEDKKL